MRPITIMSRTGKGLWQRGIDVLIFAALLLLSPAPAFPHPLGNFSINHYAGIEVRSDSIAIHYVIDMAEIPTFQELQESGITPQDGHPSLSSYLPRKMEELKQGLVLTVNGTRVGLSTEGQEITFPPGVGGLPTMKISGRFRAQLDPARLPALNQVLYQDTNFQGRAGWKEIVVFGTSPASLQGSSTSTIDRSQQLSSYPTDLLNSPPQDLEARFLFATVHPPPPRSTELVAGSRQREGGVLSGRLSQRGKQEGNFSVPSPLPNCTLPISDFGLKNEGILPKSEICNPKSTIDRGEGEGGGAEQRLPAVASGPSQRPKTRDPDRLARPVEEMPDPSASPQPQRRGASKWDLQFMRLITAKDLGLGVILLSLLLAFSLGAFHALEPGHGKTVVAAYLVGSRGTAGHALLLGLIVTATHTAGVYLLGLVTLSLSKYVFPERLYPWLGFLSGMAIVGMGLIIFSRHYHRLSGGGPEVLPTHHHPHDHDHHHPHRHGHLHRHKDREPGAVSYRELFALGITGGIVPCPAALVVLLSAISLGRISFGLLLIVAFSAGLALVLMGIGLLMVYARRFMARFTGEGRLLHRLPLVSSLAIALLGIVIALQSLVSGGLLPIKL